jgi:hypothetical protein
MSERDQKDDLRRYLQDGRDALLWKLEGASEYDVIAETDRHAGHADIVRELIDGAAGLRRTYDNLAPGDAARWADYRRRLEETARVFSETGSGPGLGS